MEHSTPVLLAEGEDDLLEAFEYEAEIMYLGEGNLLHLIYYEKNV